MPSMADLVEDQFADKLDALAAVVEACSYSVREGDVIPVANRPWDWEIPQYAIDVVSAIFSYTMEYWDTLTGELDDPEEADAYTRADELERYERVAQVVNFCIAQRGAPAGDWTFFKWMTACPIDWGPKYGYE